MIEWKKSDADIGRAMQQGEKAVKIPLGEQAWSKKLQARVYSYQYWKKRLKMSQYPLETNSEIKDMQKCAELTDKEAAMVTLAIHIKEQIMKAKKALRLAQKDSINLRKHDIHTVIADLAGQPPRRCGINK